MANYEQLKQLSHAQPTMYSDRFVQVQDKHGNYTYKQNTYYAVNDRKVISSIQPVTQVPTSLSNAVVDYKLDNKLCDVLDFLDLELNFTNSTGGATVYKPAPLLLNRFDIISAQGVNLFTSQDQEIYMSNFFLDKSAYESLAGVQDLSASTYGAVGTSTANLGSLRLNIMLHGMFKACRLPLCALDGPLTIRFYFNPSTLYVTSGSEMTCSSMSLVAHGRRLSTQAKNEIINIFHNGRIPISLSHLSVDRMTLTQSLTASTTINIPLNGLKGICSFLVFTIRLASTYLTSAPITYLACDSFDILDSSSSSLIGHLARNRNIQKIHWAHCFGNDVMNQTGVNFVSFAIDPRDAFGKGSNSGFVVFTGNESLRINLSSAITTASHIIDIRAYMHESIQFTPQNGIKAIRD